MAPAQKYLMKVLLQIKPVNIPESVKEGLTRLHPLGEKLLAAAERESVFFRDVVPGRPTTYVHTGSINWTRWVIKKK